MKKKLEQLTIKEFVALKENDFHNIEDTKMLSLLDKMNVFFGTYDDQDYKGLTNSFKISEMNKEIRHYIDVNHFIRRDIIFKMSKIFTPQQLMCICHSLHHLEPRNKQKVYEHINKYGNIFYDLDNIKKFKRKISRISKTEFDILMDILIDNSDQNFIEHLRILFKGMTMISNIKIGDYLLNIE